MPLAFDTIEDKLTRRQYPNLTTLESDLKRLVANAKGYNEKTSELFADAERIRKMVSHFMQKHNPAYKNPNYTAFPTPLPDNAHQGVTRPSTTRAPAAKVVEGTMDVDGDVTMDAMDLRGGSRATRRSSTAKAAPVKAAGVKAKSATPIVNTPSLDFEGKSFQAAQEQIVTEMIKLQDEE